MGHRQHIISKERYILFSVRCLRKQGRVKYICVLLSHKGSLSKAGKVSKLSINLAYCEHMLFLTR